MGKSQRVGCGPPFPAPVPEMSRALWDARRPNGARHRRWWQALGAIPRGPHIPMALVLSMAGNWAPAQERSGTRSFGLQAALVIPVGDDLRITTGSGPGFALGVHARWDFNEFHGLRPRLDLYTFSRGQQEVVVPQVQRIETKVQGIALGVEYLYRPKGNQGSWAVGGGLYAIRWSVESSNRLDVPVGGTAGAAGTSRWTRAGLGLVSAYRFTPRLEAEVRWISSRYGYENLPANMATAGLLWRF